MLLVLVATVLGSVVVASADDRVPVYAARTPLIAGQPLTADQVVRVDVQLGDLSPSYLAASEALTGREFVLRDVPAGDLVPRSALGTPGDVGLQPLTLMVDETSSSALVVGSVVDVYANPLRAGGGSADFAGPELVLEGVTVSRLPERGSGFAGPSSTAAVQVMAPSERVKGLIGLVDAGARITLVPVPGSAVRSDS